MAQLETPDPGCCETATKARGLFWIPPEDIRFTYTHNSYGPAAPGWAFISNVGLEYRGMFWLMNIEFCPFCGVKLPTEPNKLLRALDDGGVPSMIRDPA